MGVAFFLPLPIAIGIKDFKDINLCESVQSVACIL